MQYFRKSLLVQIAHFNNEIYLFLFKPLHLAAGKLPCPDHDLFFHLIVSHIPIEIGLDLTVADRIQCRERNCLVFLFF